MFGLPGSWTQVSKEFIDIYHPVCGCEHGTWSDESFEIDDTMCKEPVEWRLQGETDSFGAEYFYYCSRHKKQEQDRVKEWYNSPEAEELQKCDWCKTLVPAKDLQKHRDFEEGTASPIYDVCSKCRHKETQSLLKEQEYDDDRPCNWRDIYEKHVSDQLDTDNDI